MQTRTEVANLIRKLTLVSPSLETVQNFVTLAAGGFGNFLRVSLYSTTVLSAGAPTRTKSPLTSRASCGSISILKLGVTGHGGTGNKESGLALRSGACRINISEVHAPVLPARPDQVWPYEAQQALAMPLLALAEQDVGLVDAVSGSVGILPPTIRKQAEN